MAPTSASGFQFYARIFLNSPNDADYGTLTDPYGNPYTMTWDANQGALVYGDNSFSNEADEEAAYPDGTYTYTTNGGTNGYDGSTATVVVGPSDFSTTVPFLTGGSYSALQEMNAGQNLTVTWNPWVDALGTNSDYTYFTIANANTGATVYSNVGSASGYTSQTINAGTLAAGTAYTYTLYFSSRNFQSANGNGAFTGIGGLSADDYGTSGTFMTAAPEPFTMAGVALGAVALLRRRRRA